MPESSYLLYLPPYSPDPNPIEEFFAELKAFIRRNWKKCQGQNFKDFLEWSLEVVGAKGSSIEGHCRHTGVELKEE